MIFFSVTVLSRPSLLLFYRAASWQHRMDTVWKPLASDTLRTRLGTDGGRGDTPLFGPCTVYAASKGMIFSPSVVRNRVSILALWFQTERYGFCNLGLELSMVFR